MKSLIPKHIAITMDGNGRWGKQKGLTRSEGHFAGTQAMEKVIDGCIELGVEALTLYAFSSENWSRPKSEVNYLMFLPIKFFNQKLPEFMRRNIKILISGDIKAVPRSTRNAITKAMEKTKYNDGMIVNFAFNYGGRADILQAVQQIVQEARQNRIDLDQLDETLFQRFLYTKELPDPDLFIRTGGEQRMSNFLLWQSATSELYFSDIYFPDFGKEELEKVVCEWSGNNSYSTYYEQSM